MPNFPSAEVGPIKCEDEGSHSASTGYDDIGGCSSPRYPYCRTRPARSSWSIPKRQNVLLENLTLNLRVIEQRIDSLCLESMNPREDGPHWRRKNYNRRRRCAQLSRRYDRELPLCPRHVQRKELAKERKHERRRGTGERRGDEGATRKSRIAWTGVSKWHPGRQVQCKGPGCGICHRQGQGFCRLNFLSWFLPYALVNP